MTERSLRLAPHILVTETGRRLDAEVGRLTVPTHHADPGGPSLELAFYRLPARTTSPGPPIVLLAGGPGGSGMEFLTWDTDGWPEFIAGLQDLGDVIALDQRGTGASGPVPLALERWDLPLDVPGDRSAVVERALERSTALREQWVARGVDISAYTTVESADDVARLANALGAHRIRLYGTSYGSHLGLSILRRHEPIVDRAILGLVEGPDHTMKLPSVVDAAFEHTAAMAADELGGGAADLPARLSALLASLDARPMAAGCDGETVVVGRHDLQRAVADCVGSQDDLALLPARIRRLEDGDFGWVAEAARERRTDWFPDAMYLHTDAASGASPARRERIAAEADGTLLGDVINLPFPDVEAAWGYPDLGDMFRSPIAAATPVQFYSGRLDGRTPPSNVDELIGGFTRSGHLIIDGIAHDDGIIAADVRARLVGFLGGEEPSDGTASIPFRFSPLDP